MNVLWKLEEKEDLKIDTHKLRDFLKSDKKKICEKLEEVYVDFIGEYLKENPNTCIADIEMSRQLLDYIKKNI